MKQTLFTGRFLAVVREGHWEYATLFRATGLRRAGQGGGVGREEIEVHEVPLSGVRKWLVAKAESGVLVDPKVYTGLYFAGLSG